MRWRRGTRKTGQAGVRGSYQPACEPLEGRRLPTVSATSADPPIVSAEVGEASDPDANGIVSRPRVVVAGQAAPGAVVRLDRDADGSVERATRADSRGHFRFTVAVPRGLTRFGVSATDGLGRQAEDEVVVARGDAVLDWNATLLEAIRADRTAPPVAARALAMVHVAIYDAVNAVERRHVPYAVDVRAPWGSSAEAAAAQAAFRVATALFPGQADRFEATLEETLAAVRPGRARATGRALGERVGRSILALRADDGVSPPVANTLGPAAGDWVPTPPGYAPALLSHWPGVAPFGIASGSRFRPPDPPALDSARYAAEVAEARALGSAGSTARTADQTAIALFWSDGAGTSTPAGHWNQIAEDLLLGASRGLGFNARLLALLNVAEADAALVSWDAKYTYDRWRPVTAIRRADADGNPATGADPSWAPLLATPPFPSYTSGHSSFSGAAGEVLAAFFGADLAFEARADRSLALPPRRFAGFQAAADEAGRSRIYGGIHFESDNIQGLIAGRAVARHVLEHVATRRRPRG